MNKEYPIMACGCMAQGVQNMRDGTQIPCCITHGCTEVAKEIPDLRCRVSRCVYCGHEEPSSYTLPFFEFRGRGSRYALHYCKCGLLDIAHRSVLSGDRAKCTKFQSAGAAPHDRHYCGCRGWD